MCLAFITPHAGIKYMVINELRKIWNVFSVMLFLIKHQNRFLYQFFLLSYTIMPVRSFKDKINLSHK